MRKKLLTLTMAVLVGLVFCGGNCFADGGGWVGDSPITHPGGGSSGGGGGGGGGGGSVNCDTATALLECLGYSWVYFRSVVSPSEATDMLFRPWPQDVSEASKIPSECAEHTDGGFWHFGRNGYSRGAYNGNGYFASYDFLLGVSQNKYTYTASKWHWGHFETYSYGDYRTCKNSNGGKFYTTGKACYQQGNFSQALYKKNSDGSYKKIYEIDNEKSQGGEAAALADYQIAYASMHPGASVPSSFPDNLYAFCYWSDMGSTYYGRSNVAITGGGWTGTGIRSTYAKAELAPVTVNVGAKVKITFSHNAYASQAANGVKWKVDREWKNSNAYTFPSQLTASVSGTVNLDKKSGNYYIPTTTNYVDSSNVMYAFREEISNVEFNAPGTYEFCESFTIDESSVADKPLTRACAKVNVIGYAAQSNVGDSVGGWSSTGIVEAPGTKTISNTTVYAKVKTQIPVTFSHTVYANTPVENVSWAVKRDLDHNKVNTGNQRYSIVARPNDANDNGDNGLVSLVERSGDSLTVATENKKYYWAPVEQRPYMDGGDNPSHYSWRDKYWVTYKKVGNYENSICETMSVPGNNHGITTVCASTIVPYNFENTATVEIGGDSVVYDGGAISLSKATVNVGKKVNNAVKNQGAYATQVDSAKVRLISYLSSSLPSGSNNDEIRGWNAEPDLCYAIVNKEACAVTSISENANFNADNNIDGVEESLGTGSYGVFDADAGKYYCVALAVYPYTSGSDTNYNDVKGSDTWYISKPSCKQMAKHPSVQVYGGSVYSEGSIKTSISPRTGFGENGNDTLVFGSWAEQSATANDAIIGFASGAAMSQGSSTNYCKYSTPLTFANFSLNLASQLCNPTMQNGFTYQAGYAGIPADTSGKNALIDYWWPANPVALDSDTISSANASGGLDLTVASNYYAAQNANGGPMRYTYARGNLILKDATIDGITDDGYGITHVVRSENGNIHINGNIQYADRVHTSSLTVPKLIIYARNIYIGCNVRRVDAILVAEEVINTCADANGASLGVDASERSSQLTINGVLIAEQILFNRTYGAGKGNAVKIPAEIVNYDTTTMLWDRGTADHDDDGRLTTTVYLQELAPRY